MRRSYRHRLALPPSIAFDVTWQDDADVNQAAVNAFVNSLNEPKWYKNYNGDRNYDTRLWMLEVVQPFSTRSDGRGRLERTWVCQMCGSTEGYAGIHVGHTVNWKQHLKDAGVLTQAEAKAAYNNLCNLRIECATCNQSHDWEPRNF